jgi:hypothetical protein
MAVSVLPRGIRNHNPGNLVRDGTNWKGLSADQTADSRFCVFKEPVWGVRALAKVLLTYRNKHGLKTVAQIISRYAPPVENDTDAYVGAVARALGVSVDDALELDEAVLIQMVKAIIRHENGHQPYSDSVVVEAVRMALIR